MPTQPKVGHRVEIDQFAIDHETHDFEAQPKFENGPLRFLVKIIDRLCWRVFRNRGEHVEHER